MACPPRRRPLSCWPSRCAGTTVRWPTRSATTRRRSRPSGPPRKRPPIRRPTRCCWTPRTSCRSSADDWSGGPGGRPPGLRGSARGGGPSGRRPAARLGRCGGGGPWAAPEPRSRRAALQPGTKLSACPLGHARFPASSRPPTRSTSVTTSVRSASGSRSRRRTRRSTAWWTCTRSRCRRTRPSSASGPGWRPPSCSRPGSTRTGPWCSCRVTCRSTPSWPGCWAASPGSASSAG